MMKQLLVLLILFSLAAGGVDIRPPEQRNQSPLLVLIDSLTLSRIEPAVRSYCNSLQQDGLSPWLISANWSGPLQVRGQIIRMREQQLNPEGVVLIGDIPIAMVRRAQHLTSAFKIDENKKRFGWQRTSVPSDRFYDDLDLRWEFVKQDSANPLLYYFDLAPDSPQKIECDLYSGRICGTGTGQQKITSIKNYLLRVARYRTHSKQVDRALVFTGHGYHSEALDAWSSALLACREQFPRLFRPGGRLSYYNHAMDPGLKNMILAELQNPQLDLAIFHAHGAEDTQYLLGIEPAASLTQNIESIRLFLRGKLRQARRRKRSIAETKLDFMKRHDLPLSWFEKAFDDSLRIADSLLYASHDIHLEDIGKINPMADFIVFDECFNGAFFHDRFVAGEYVFGRGRTVAALANSVNVKQDIWADQFLGLLPHGLRVGHLVRLRNQLESHIIGDPTFHFGADDDPQLVRFLSGAAGSAARAERWLKDSRPPVRALAVCYLGRSRDSQAARRLVRIYEQDSSYLVRTQAVISLAATRDPLFEQLLPELAVDPHEFLRRLAVIWMGDVGKAEYLPVLAALRLTDPSERVRFNAQSSLEQIDTQKAVEAIRAAAAVFPDSSFRKKQVGRAARSFNRTRKWLYEDLLKRLADPTEKLSRRISSARTFRNYRFQESVARLLKVAADSAENTTLRCTVIEALGWYGFSRRRDAIISACDEILSRNTEPSELKKITLMTKNRLVAGPNNAVTP